MDKIPSQNKRDASEEASAQAEERRRHRRYDAAVDVRFRELRPTGEDDPLHCGQTMNISHTGLFIKTNCFFRLGTLLELHVDVLTPENELRELAITAQVAWISFEDSLPGMGVEFKHLDDELRRVILAHVYRSDLKFLGPDCAT